jgi:transcriptional regulator CtsR
MDKFGKEIKRSDGAYIRIIKLAVTENVEVWRMAGKIGTQNERDGK